MNWGTQQYFRIILVFVVGSSAVAASSRAHASFWDNLWKTPHQQNSQQEQAGNYEALTSDNTSPEWAGVGHYRAGDFAAAAEQFSSSDDVTSQYNQATSLTQAGQFDEALELFDDVLKADPEHEKALKNRDIARQLKEIQQQQQQQQQQDGEQGDEGEQSEEDQQQGQQQDQQDKGEKQDGEQQESQQNSGEEQDQQAGDQSSEEQAAKDQKEAAESESDFEPSEEKEAEEQTTTAEELSESMTENQQATEQWLRRIPDDPTGLLRRKLQRSHSTDFPGVGDSASPW